MKLRLFEIVTDFDKVEINDIKTILENKDCIRDYAYILHDKEETRSHYHIAVRLKDSYETKHICQWFNVPENFVSRVKGRWSDMLKYLIHENAPEKYQYDYEEVYSNFDWIKEKEKTTGKQRLEQIINDIVEGNIREYNYTETISPIEHDMYSRSIDRAFKYRTDKIKGVARDMECIFITGDSGTGKTTYAKQVAENSKYSVYVSSGSNDILDDYKGQDCIILDDLRPSSIGLSDLLKMLDNHTSSTVKSRYRNKVLECKLIIITTTLDIDTFFRNVFADDIETSIQLKRRCKTHIRMTLDYIYAKLWQDISRSYGKEYRILNSVTMEYKIKEMSEEEQLLKLSELLGDFKELVDDVKNNPPDEFIDNSKEYKQIDLSDNPFK